MMRRRTRRIVLVVLIDVRVVHFVGLGRGRRTSGGKVPKGQSLGQWNTVTGVTGGVTGVTGGGGGGGVRTDREDTPSAGQWELP